MNRRRSRNTRLPDEWQVYTGKRRAPVKRSAPPVWKYAVWGVLLGGLGSAAVLLSPAGSTEGRNALVATLTTETVQRNFALCHTGGGTNCVVDGDTIWLDGAKIRVADIDTPETHDPKCAAELALGQRATQRLLQLVNAGPFEVQPVGDRDADKYGRKLRVLVRGGQSLGDVLVSEGLARTWTGRREPWC